MNEVLEAFWFFLPAGVSNMSPVLANKIPGLNRWQTPMDFGHSWRGSRIFGDNKRWRGVIFGTVMGMVTAGITHFTVYDSSGSLARSLLVGALLGFGALLGDAVESFCKRRIGIKPGNLWFPFDQIDFIIGGLVLVYAVARPPAMHIVYIFLIYFGLTLAGSYFAYLLKLKDKPI